MKRLIVLTVLFFCGFASAQTNYARMLSGVNYQTGTSYSLQPGDVTKPVSFANNSAVAVCLSSTVSLCSGVAPVSNQYYGVGSIFTVTNGGAGVVTITCSSCTINGSSNLQLASTQGADIYSDGLNYIAILAFAANSGGSPSIIGPSVGSPECIVEGVVHPTILSCINYLQTTLGLNGGTIYSRVPEEMPIGLFALTNFHGLVKLGNDTTNSGICGQGPTFNCWTTDGPLVMTDALRIEGVNEAELSTSQSRGTAITFSATFPSALGAPATPTFTGLTTGGNITCASSPCTYFFQIDESNNLLGTANNANAQRGPGHSAVSAEGSCTIGSNTTTGSCTFPSPAQLTSSNMLFNAVDVGIYSSLASGQEQQNLPGTDVNCPGANGVVDKRGCNFLVSGVWTSGTIIVTAIPAQETGPPTGRLPPMYLANGNDSTGYFADGSNPLVVEQVGTPGTDPNIFNTVLEHVLLQGSPTNVTTSPLSNAPAIMFLNTQAEENAGAFQVIANGAWGANGNLTAFYTGMRAGNSFLRDIHIPSNAGPSSGTFCMVDVVVDGRGGSNGGARYFENASLNGNNGTGCYRMLVTGSNADIEAGGLHIESRGDGIFVDNVGGGTFWATSATVPITFDSIHGSSTADMWCGYVGKEGDAHPAIRDDKNNVTVTPGTGLGGQYCSQHYFGNILTRAVFGTVAPACTGGELALSAGWGNTASVNSVGSLGGFGQTCQWTITASGSGQSVNPTVTDTLNLPLPSVTVVCDMVMTGGSGTFGMFARTAPVTTTTQIFTYSGTPSGTQTFTVTRRCGP